MKTADVFWSIISQYNIHTLYYQFILFVFLIGSIIFAYWKRIFFFPKISLGITNIFISIVFFVIFDKSPIGLFFAAPLYGLIGLLFIYDCIKNSKVEFISFDKISIILLVLTLLYPLLSFVIGHKYPRQVLYILPCPVISFSIIIYSRYKKQSLVLLILMTVWALTGIKAFIFDVYEDLILFTTSFYGIYLIVKKIKEKKQLTNL